MSKNLFLNKATFDKMLDEVKTFESEVKNLPGLDSYVTKLDSKTGITVRVRIRYPNDAPLTDKRLEYICGLFTPLLRHYHLVCKKGYNNKYSIEYYAKPDWLYWKKNQIEESE